MIPLTPKNILLFILFWIPTLILFIFLFKWIKGQNKTVFKRYDWFYWCRTCQKWIPKEEVVTAKNGRLLCPYCHQAVRVRARQPRRRKA